MQDYANSKPTFEQDTLRLEAVTACVGFGDLLDVTLALNHPHLDTLIVVTSHDDKETQAVARKHGAICVQTDLFKKNGRGFNKGAALNAGFSRFQYHGWRLHLDSDIILPDNFRRLVFNHSHLDADCIYGADRVDVIGPDELKALQGGLAEEPQHSWSTFTRPAHPRAVGARYVDTAEGYVPIGYFQLWNAKAQKPYPHSLGDAAHDDVAFAAQWARQHRRLLPTVFCYHLLSRPGVLGENWDGVRRQPRFEK